VLKHRLDAHLHLQTIPWISCTGDTSGRDTIDSFILKGGKFICNGTSPLDWDLVTALAKLYPEELVPFYGVHPWYVDALPENWLENLQSHLAGDGRGIGEIGLDKASSHKVSFDLQKEVFKIQLQLAVSMKLPISLHCVRAWESLLKILEETVFFSTGSSSTCKVPVMIHSFSGSMEIMKYLTDFGVFLSFSSYLMTEKAEKLNTVFKAVPLKNILIESDFSFNKNNSFNFQIIDYTGKLESLYHRAASLKNMDSLKFQEAVYINGKVFTNRASDWQRKHGYSAE